DEDYGQSLRIPERCGGGNRENPKPRDSDTGQGFGGDAHSLRSFRFLRCHGFLSSLFARPSSGFPLAASCSPSALWTMRNPRSKPWNRLLRQPSPNRRNPMLLAGSVAGKLSSTPSTDTVRC